MLRVPSIGLTLVVLCGRKCVVMFSGVMTKCLVGRVKHLCVLLVTNRELARTSCVRLMLLVSCCLTLCKCVVGRARGQRRRARLRRATMAGLLNDSGYRSGLRQRLTDREWFRLKCPRAN